MYIIAFFLLLLSCIVVFIRELTNKFFSTNQILKED